MMMIKRNVFVVVPPEKVSRYKARSGRSPAEMVPLRQDPKSMTISVILLIAIFAFIIGFITVLSIFVGRPKSPQPPTPLATSPEMTSSNSPSSVCHVIGNKTKCFRFASNLTRSRCSEIGGVIIHRPANSSSSSPSSPPSSSSAAASNIICYHNICMDYVVDNRFCFLNRSRLPSRL